MFVIDEIFILLCILYCYVFLLCIIGILVFIIFICIIYLNIRISIIVKLFSVIITCLFSFRIIGY